MKITRSYAFFAKTPASTRRSSYLLAVLAAVSPVAAHGQSLASLLPAKPVVIVVPNTAAGPNDFLARVLAPKLSEAVRQNVIVDNRPSANGVIAGEIVARAAPDGSMIAVGYTGTHAINATLYKRFFYDPVRDFAPIRSRVVAQGHEIIAGGTPEQFAEQVRRDAEKYRKIILDAGMQQDL